MNVLVACEESQAVCKEFRARGHRAFSCDVQECSGGHPEWHIMGDVLPLLNGTCTFKLQDGSTDRQTGRWDLIIAFPPCTHLAVSGAAHFEKKRQDGRQREGIEFFCKFLGANADKIVIENPVGIISGDYITKWFPDLSKKYNLPRKPTQIIHPWQFGDNYEKSTCLWEKGVTPLIPQVTERPELDWFEYTDKKTGRKKRQPQWFVDALSLPPEERARVRSKTFSGIARAMAEQWGRAESIQKREPEKRDLRSKDDHKIGMTRIRGLLTAWAQLTDEEKRAVNEVLLWELYKITREGKYEGQAIQRAVRTDADDKRDQGTHGADGYLGVVADTGSNKV